MVTVITIKKLLKNLMKTVLRMSEKELMKK